MKKLIIALNVMLMAMSATAATPNNLLSLLRANSKPTKSTTVKTTPSKSTYNFESISSQYSKGIISADSIINFAVSQKAENPELAEQCLKLVASEGNKRGTLELGVLYAFTPTFSSQAKEGVKLLETASKEGNEKANDYLGFYYFQKKDYDTAKKYFDARHTDHEGFASTALGSMYLEGKGVREDGAKARENYHKGALKGYSRGMTLYANLLGTKNGGSLDYPDAFFWHYIAGELGENLSRVTLFRPMLPQAPATDEVGQDSQLAMQWIEKVHSGMKLQNQPIYKDGFLKGLKETEKAAEQGDDWSRFYLGSMNYNGDFLNKNYPQAIRYYEQISKNGKLPASVLTIVNERLAEMKKK